MATAVWEARLKTRALSSWEKSSFCPSCLHFPSEDINGDSRLLKRFLASTFRNHPPDVVINNTDLLSVSDNVLFELRQTGFSYRIVSCFRNNPFLFKDNHRSLVRHLLRNKRWVLFFIDHPLGWMALLLWHRLKNRYMFSKVLSLCDRYLLLSPTFISELRWFVPDLDESKIIIIPNAFQMPDIRFLKPKCKRFLFVGRLQQAQKNILILPNIWKKVQHRLPEWELHIVGDGPDRSELESKIGQLSLERVQLHGQMNSTEHYSVAKIFLMLSFFEGFGNTLIEAQMHGVVPVAFRSYSAVEWMLNDGIDAMLVPPFDVDRYADALVQLATDEDKWTCMSAAALSNAQRFSEKAVGDIWLKVLSEVMHEPLESAK